MGLRQTAERDLGLILEDQSQGFGWPITLTNPEDVSVDFVGFSDDISQVIDPDTGVAVSGRMASIALRISSIYAAGFTLPVGVADSGSLPWVVSFNDINGNSHLFKISKSNPDRAAGLLTCLLELYE